jgi:hypothetical protein
VSKKYREGVHESQVTIWCSLEISRSGRSLRLLAQPRFRSGAPSSTLPGNK